MDELHLRPLLKGACRSWLLGLEHRLEQIVDGLARAMATRRAHRLLSDPTYLRGRECHCRPGPPLHLLHSEGIREGCDWVIDYGSNVQHRFRKQVPVELLARAAHDWEPGDVVHVKADLLGQFVQHVLPAIRNPIILVTGDSDSAPVKAFEGLLEDDRIAHWFAQNCDVPYRHPRLTRLPIGFDNPVFTRLDQRLGVLVTMLLGRTPFDASLLRNDMGNQALLQQIHAQTATTHRPLRALCTFHRSGKIVPDMETVPGRLETYQDLKDNPSCWFAPRRLPQEACWRIHDEFAFEVSPRGRGLDCFRTWEALFLGTIPLVLSSPLDPLYQDEDLPVVVVVSWSDLTPIHLERWRKQMEPRFTDRTRQKLTVDHWLARIHETARKVARR